MSRKNVVFSYLHRKKKSLLGYMAFLLIFVGIFYLYNLPKEPLWYAVLLCSWIGAIVLIFDFMKFGKRHRFLCDLTSRITLDIPQLPRPEDLLEKDYQELLRTLYRHLTDAASRGEQERQDLVEYYTLWAHQIKTPIAAMRLLLQSEENPESWAELLMELFKIEEYVEMVLQYLRVESPSSDFVLKHYSLDNIVRQVARKYAKMFIRQKIRLDFSDLNCEVLTDEKWLVFVIGQVFSNALKYTETGTISVFLEDRDKKVLVIQDTGIGIPAEDLPRVFEQGFTGSVGRLEKKSTGIGLYLCKRIMDKLSHTIEIESEVGSGTKVKIRLDTLDPWSE